MTNEPLCLKCDVLQTRAEAAEAERDRWIDRARLEARRHLRHSDEFQREIWQLQKMVSALKHQRIGFEAERDALKALTPLAVVEASLSPSRDDDEEIAVEVTVGDVRRARSALSAQPVPSAARDARIAEMEAALRAWERWEADIILEPDCWREEDGLPHLTQDLWDRVIELQELRNAALVGLEGEEGRDRLRGTLEQVKSLAATMIALAHSASEAQRWGDAYEWCNAALSGQPAPDLRDALVEAAVDVRNGANIDTMRALAVAVDAYLKERGDV